MEEKLPESAALQRLADFYRRKGDSTRARDYEARLLESASPQKRGSICTDYERVLDSRRRERYRVSALVSVYKSEALIRGCLDNLVQQTLYLRGELEIVVVDSASPENEWSTISEYAAKYLHIMAVRTPEREPLYKAWNRGIMLSRGDYLANANCDDRRRLDGLEVMAGELDGHLDAALVYGDCHLSFTPNETYEQNEHRRIFRYPEYFAPASLLHYQFGPQPMWRRSVHDIIGLFDDSYRAAGDWDFNLRLALKLSARHIPQPLGLYLEHPGAITFKDDTMARENRRVSEAYQHPETIVALYTRAGAAAETPPDRARILLDMGNRALEYFPPWKEGGAEWNLELANVCYRAAARLQPEWSAPSINLAVCLAVGGRVREAMNYMTRQPWSGSVYSRLAASNQQALEEALRTGRLNGGLRLAASGLDFPSQRELADQHKNIQRPRSQDCRLKIADCRLPEGRQNQNESTEKELRICFFAGSGAVNPTGVNGGMETALLQTARSLAKRGHKVAMVSRLTAGTCATEAVWHLPLEAWERGAHPEWREEIDLLAFASGPDRQPYTRVPIGVPKVALFHHQEPAFMTGCNPRRVLNEAAEAVICVSQAVKQNLVRAGIGSWRVLVVPNGIDIGLFHPQPVERNFRRVMFVGALVRDKNPDMLIRAFLQLAPQFPDAELHIFGSASLWGAPEYLNRELVERTNPRVRFHGIVGQEELAAEYSRSGLCVIPSRFESFSLVSLEAQACGCIPLAAEVGGIPETMLPGRTGFLYSPNDLPTLGLALNDLLSHPDKIRAASEQAPDFVKAKFSWDKTAEAYERIFQKVIAASRRNCAAAGAVRNEAWEGAAV